MSGNRLVWHGLEELRAALRTLPADLTGEASHIVEGAANGAAVTLKAGYHVISGELRDGVIVTHFDKGRFSAGALVKNRSKLAWLYDNGSQARHYISKAGTRHNTGAMWSKSPAPHLFVQTMLRARRRMYEQLKELLVRHGLQVSGDA